MIRPTISPRFIRFVLIGGLNTAVGYGLFALLVFWDLPYPVAIALSTLGGIAFNFQTTGRLVFKHAPLSRISCFAGVYGLTYVLNVLAIGALLRVGVDLYLANAITLFPLALLTYTLQKNLVFKAL